MNHPEISGVMQVVDSLALGGTETVAVNLANRLPRHRFRSFLCTTRGGGPLLEALAKDTGYLPLERKSILDWQACRQLRSFVRNENIRLLHVHATSLFFAKLCALFPDQAGVRIVWHDHYGRCEQNDRSETLYRLATRNVGGVIAVNNRLAEWSRRRLRLPSDRVWYIPNFSSPREDGGSQLPSLPGVRGSRLVCVANFRPQKAHLTLIRAMDIVHRKRPDAQLILVGSSVDREYEAQVRAETAARGLENCVMFWGASSQVAQILRACDVAVLSSSSEGLPLSLLEYGNAGLPAVATDVGQCAEVLDQGRAGSLVPPDSPEPLAGAILELLESSDLRAARGRALREFVARTYDSEAIIGRIADIYDLVLNHPVAKRRAA